MLLENQTYLDKEILDKLNIDYKKVDGLYDLTSNNICYLDEYLGKFHNNIVQYNFGLKATNDFLIQIKNFQDRGFTFLAFNITEVLVIDSSKFLLIPKDTHKLDIINYKVNVNYLKEYLLDNDYVSPELRELQSNYLHLTTNYYSLGLILLKIIFNNIIIQNLQNIKYTPLYYCIYRCIQINPNHRYFVLV